MSENHETLRIDHKPHLTYPYQLRSFNQRTGKWFMLQAFKNEAQAFKRLEFFLARKRGKPA